MLLPVACTLLTGVPAEIVLAGDDDDFVVAVPEKRDLTPEEELGKLLFFEEALSTPPGQACAECHMPEVGFANPVKEIPVSRGVIHGRYGNRNDLPAAYSMFAPPLHFEEDEGIWEGGLFWDGRVNTLEEQAMGPPFNPLEMANVDTFHIADSIRGLEYADQFEKIYGEGALDDEHDAFRNMAQAIAAFERTWEFARFDSKFDLFKAGKVELTHQEMRGLEIFEAEDKGNCAACHPTTGEDGLPPMFTDFTYDNLGVPRNPANPFLYIDPEFNPDGLDWVDPGLAATLDDPAELGKFRVPTLRNVAITGPYMHNGVFNTLWEVVTFYNTRDVASWPDPEVFQNLNREELGDLGLTNSEMEDLVVFLKTLTDGYDAE